MRRLVISLATCGLLLSTTASAEETSQRTAGKVLTVTGLSVFAASYIITGAATTATVLIANARGATIAESWVPLAGPWIMLADSAGFDSGQLAATTVAAIVQTLSFGAFVTGVTFLATSPSQQKGVMITPTATARGGGVSLSVTF